MSKLSDFRKVDYMDLEEAGKQEIYCHYVEESISKMLWISVVVFFGELILTTLDFTSGFFNENSLNYLNFFAEALLMVSSLAVYFDGRRIISYYGDDSTEISFHKKAKLLINLYRLVIMIAICLFVFTDVVVRGKGLGPYIIFLFIFEVVPFYHFSKNLLVYIFIGLFTTLVFIVSNGPKAGTLFSTASIFVAFLLASEYLRTYYIKQLIHKFRAEMSNLRFENLTTQSISALANAVEAKDMYTKGHSQRVAQYSSEIANRLGYSDDKQREVYFIGLMHDIGKIGIPDAVINKEGKLTDEEFAAIKTHPVIGYEILKNITELTDISQGARWHHERYDGRGYPDGLEGEHIPLIAQIVAVADAYDAMTSNRSYRKALPQSIVREEIERNKGKQFSCRIADIMLQMIDEDKEYKLREINTNN